MKTNCIFQSPQKNAQGFPRTMFLVKVASQKKFGLDCGKLNVVLDSHYATFLCQNEFLSFLRRISLTDFEF